MTADPTNAQLVESWRNAAAPGAVADELEAVFAAAAAEIASRGPACWASGRCCNFREAGHRLYVTGLETAYCVARLPGEQPTSLAERILDASARGGCPFQDRNLCGVHAIKPLGCRVYFCDRSAQAWQMELSENLIGDIKALHDRHGIPYRYGEWLSMLRMFTG